MQRQLKRLNSNHTQLLLTELKNVDTLAVTTDLWSDKKLNSYMCLTGHYVSQKNQFISKGKFRTKYVYCCLFENSLNKIPLNFKRFKLV